MAVNKNQVTKAKTLLSQLNNVNLSDPNAHEDAILKCQSLLNTLQDPRDKAMEGILSVSDHFCNGKDRNTLTLTHRLRYFLACML